MGLFSAESMGGAASGAATGAQLGGPWGAVIGGGLGLASGMMGGKSANKPKTTTTTSQLEPFGGSMGNSILNNILGLAQDTYLDNPPMYIGPSESMGVLFNQLLGHANVPYQYTSPFESLLNNLGSAGQPPIVGDPASQMGYTPGGGGLGSARDVRSGTRGAY